MQLVKLHAAKNQLQGKTGSLGGKKWAVRDSRSDSFRIKFRLSPNKYNKQTIKSKHNNRNSKNRGQAKTLYVKV